MRYDNLEEKYDQTIRAGCWGCAIYIALFFGAGGILIYFKFEWYIFLSVPILAVFVMIWFIFFARARKKDKKNKDKPYR